MMRSWVFFNSPHFQYIFVTQYVCPATPSLSEGIAAADHFSLLKYCAIMRADQYREQVNSAALSLTVCPLMYASHANIEPLWQVQQDLNEANTWAYLIRVTACLCVWADTY